jgi:hypothetical protein
MEEPKPEKPLTFAKASGESGICHGIERDGHRCGAGCLRNSGGPAQNRQLSKIPAR